MGKGLALGGWDGVDQAVGFRCVDDRPQCDLRVVGGRVQRAGLIQRLQHIIRMRGVQPLEFPRNKVFYPAHTQTAVDNILTRFEHPENLPKPARHKENGCGFLPGAAGNKAGNCRETFVRDKTYLR